MNEQEQRWIQAARGGDEAAFGELVRLYQKRVYALAVRLCPTPELAEEAAQEALEAAKESRQDAIDSAEAADTAPTPEEAAEHRELRQQIEAGLKTLSPEHRAVLVLRELHQLSYDEIAESLELDLGTVKSRISRGRRQLREFLIKHGNFFDSAASKRTERGL